MFGPATMEGDKCARQGPRGGLLLLLPRLPLPVGRGSKLLLLLLLLLSATSRDERAYLHLETGYEDARAS